MADQPTLPPPTPSPPDACPTRPAWPPCSSAAGRRSLEGRPMGDLTAVSPPVAGAVAARRCASEEASDG